MKKFINITVSLTLWDALDNEKQDFYSWNYKKIRLCNQNDFENVDFIDGFEKNPKKNFDHCIENYQGMIVASNQDTLISDNLLFQITECNPFNLLGIKCAPQEQIKNKIKYLSIFANYLT